MRPYRQAFCWLGFCALLPAQSVNITEYPLTFGAGPAGITVGPDGALWFTEVGNNKIGRMTTDGALSEYDVPTANAVPQNIAVSPDGALWFTEQYSNKIGRITTAG